MNSYDPAEMFRRLMMGQGQPPAGPAVSEPAAAATPPEEAPAQDNSDILRSIMASSGGIVEGRPDPIGGINHQGRAMEAFKKVAMAAATGGAGGGGGK